jgi:hypothetical protein
VSTRRTPRTTSRNQHQTPPATTAAARRALWWSERAEMVAFALRWAPFGGGDAEDIWVRFGISADTYFQRLHAILDGPPMPGLDDTVWQRLRVVCERRLPDIHQRHP